jgi:hypothetical protein
MVFCVTRSKVLSAAVLSLLAAITFVSGFACCLYLKGAVEAPAAEILRQKYLARQGDAPPLLRAEILAALRIFQDGYVKRDSRELDSFMRRAFTEDDDVLLLGTDGAEWARGYRAVGQFIKADWEGWGDFRSAVDDSIVWCSGDVAWLATVGTVHFEQANRPIRFTAVLTRHQDRWLFRQVHFQWDGSPQTRLALMRKSFQEFVQRFKNPQRTPAP